MKIIGKKLSNLANCLRYDYDSVQSGNNLNQTYYDELANQIRIITTVFSKTLIGKYLKYVLDEAYRQCIEEQLYIDQYEIVDFLYKSGYNTNEIMALHDVYSVTNKLKCTRCGGTLYGQCMIVTCSLCFEEYSINTLHTVNQCKECEAYLLGTCKAARLINNNELGDKDGNSSK